MNLQNKTAKKAVIIIALLLAVLLSSTILSKHFSSPESYPNTLETIDKQKQNATLLGITITATSTALTSLPDDIATTIAHELSDLSLPLFIIVCILFIQKFMLTTLGWVSFSFLIPISCLLGIIFILTNNNKLLVWIKKLIVLALTLTFIIPASTVVVRKVEDTFSESFSKIFNSATDIANKTDSDDEENGFFSFFSDLKDNVTDLIDISKNILNVLIDAIAVLIITSCIIPIICTSVLMYVVKKTLEIDIPIGKFISVIAPKRLQNKINETNENEVYIDDSDSE